MESLFTLATLLSLTLFVISAAAYIFVMLLPKPDNPLKASSSAFFHLFIVALNLAFNGFLFRFFGHASVSIFINNLFLAIAAFALLDSIFRRYEIPKIKHYWLWVSIGCLSLAIAEVLLYQNGIDILYRDLLLYSVLAIPASSTIRQLRKQIKKNRIKERTILFTSIVFVALLSSFILVYSSNLLVGNVAYISFYFLSLTVFLSAAFIGFTQSIIYSLLGKLRQQAFTDRLTGAANRDQFYHSIEKVIARVKRHNVNCALIMCDIDMFKQVNDQYGHMAGDLILKTFVESVQQELRTEDALFRIGGEEFIIVCQDCESDSAYQLAERLRVKIETLNVTYNNHNLSITASFGISDINPDLSIEQNIHLADKRLYQSKQQGRNKVTATE